VVACLNRSVKITIKYPTILLLSIISLVFGLFFSIYMSLPGWVLPWGDWVLGLGVSIFLFGLLQLNSKFVSRIVNIFQFLNFPLRWLSNISFTLYLLHFPLLILIASHFFYSSRMQPSFTSWVAFLIVLIFLLTTATGLWWLFERHTSKLRRFLTLQLGRL
jgi:peptidoglycan/LPS O-acetylase OafA/YrhL